MRERSFFTTLLAVLFCLVPMVSFAGDEVEQVCPAAETSARSASEVLLREQALPSIISESWSFALYQLPDKAQRNSKDVIEGWVSLTISNDGSKYPVNVRVVGTGDEGREVLLGELVIPGTEKVVLESVNIGGVIPSDVGPIAIWADHPVKAYAFVGGLGLPHRTLITGIPGRESTGASIVDPGQIAPQPQVTSCCGYNSTGNPYPCSCGTNTGNCTWWAWKSMKDKWGFSFPNWGNAEDWANAARAAHILVLSTAQSGTIAVNSTWGVGHVCYVTQVSGSTLTCLEMNWCLTCVRTKSYQVGSFDQGFIYPASAP